jgi:hypothetical protein
MTLQAHPVELAQALKAGSRQLRPEQQAEDGEQA